MAKKETKMKCLKCGSEKMIQRDFYRSASELHTYSNGKIPVCKQCMVEHYNKLLTIYDGKSNLAFKHLLILFDAYYDEMLYLQCIEKDNFIGEYFRLLSTKDRREKTSLNNLLSEEDSNFVSFDGGQPISEDIILRWGRGRDVQDYILLEKRYKQKLEDYPSKKPAERAIIRSMCLLELDIEEARLKNKTSVPPLEKAMMDKFKQLGINPSDNSMYDERSMLIFGVIMGIIENDYPIVDTQDRYKDVDGMHYYWYRNMIVPTMKAWDMAVGDYSLDKGINNIEVKPEIKALMEDFKDGEH